MGRPMEQKGGPRNKTTKKICPLNSDKEDKNTHWIKTAFSTVLAKLAFYLQKNGVIRFISCTWYNNQFKIDQRP